MKVELSKIQTYQVDKLCLAPGLNFIIAAGTVVSNIYKCALDIFHMKLQKNEGMETLKGPLFPSDKEKLTRHFTFIGVGLLRSIPFLGAAIRIAWNAYGKTRDFNKAQKAFNDHDEKKAFELYKSAGRKGNQEGWEKAAELVTTELKAQSKQSLQSLDPDLLTKAQKHLLNKLFTYLEKGGNLEKTFQKAMVDSLPLQEKPNPILQMQDDSKEKIIPVHNPTTFVVASKAASDKKVPPKPTLKIGLRTVKEADKTSTESTPMNLTAEKIKELFKTFIIENYNQDYDLSFIDLDSTQISCHIAFLLSEPPRSGRPLPSVHNKILEDMQKQTTTQSAVYIFMHPDKDLTSKNKESKSGVVNLLKNDRPYEHFLPSLRIIKEKSTGKAQKLDFWKDQKEKFNGLFSTVMEIHELQKNIQQRIKNKQ